MCGRRGISILLAAAILFSASWLCGCSSSSRSPDLPPHLISTPDADPERPIDGFESAALSPIDGELSDEQYRKRINELYTLVVDDRKKPLFAENDPVLPVYEAAIEILDRYILNKWHTDEGGAYNTVHALHDYLVGYIDYDYDLYDAYREGDAVAESSPSFDMDGVFLYKLAVCDGLSRAFNFLCAVENIESVRVTGTFASVPHAWNRVAVDGMWYNVDVTADIANYRVGSGGSYRKQLSHGFFMLSDETYKTFRPRLHWSDAQSNATVDYDYYADKTVTVDGTVYSCTITSRQMLNALFDDINDADGKVGKIELKLAFSGKTNINDGDMYRAEIDEAYSRLKGVDFELTATQRPYFQYPNGVYLFLMYD
ncbi:MAG: hypothetical protein NC184_02400 [Roseburia sp.]|nr:hypothetical protein [Roseburia sp.]